MVAQRCQCTESFILNCTLYTVQWLTCCVNFSSIFKKRQLRLIKINKWYCFAKNILKWNLSFFFLFLIANAYGTVTNIAQFGDTDVIPADLVPAVYPPLLLHMILLLQNQHGEKANNILLLL